MSFKPILNRILVKPDPEIKQVGSIIVPDIAKVDGEGYKTGAFVVLTGTIIAIGSTVKDEALQVGRRIQFKPCGDGRSGVELHIDGEDVLLMREDDVMGVFEEKKNAARRS